jgi:hypothetical protein
LVDVSERFLDGTKIKANASLRKNRTYSILDSQIGKIDDAVRQKLDEIAAQDAKDDALYGPDSDGASDDQCAKSDRELMLDRRARLAAAKEDLERRAKAKYDEHVSKPKDCRTHHKAPTGSPEPQDRINLTDPDSRVMTTHNKGYVQAYNAQAVVEPTHLIITDAFVTNQENDYNQLKPALSGMLKEMEETNQPDGKSGQTADEQAAPVPMRLAVDAGYRSLENLKQAAKTDGVEAYIPAKREDRSGTFVAQAPSTGDEPVSSNLNEVMDAKLATQDGHDFYAKRKCTCEPTFGMIKGCPGMGRFRQFLRRGLDKCQKDWLLICAVHNLRRYFASKSAEQTSRPKDTPRAAPIGAMNLQMAM